MDKHIIELKNVTLNRDHFQLGPINLSIPEGYITAIVGPNGSGKSTVFRLLLNLEKPDTGEIKVMEHLVNEEDDIELKKRIGYISEESTSYDNFLTAKEKAKFHQKWYPSWNERTYQNMIQAFQMRDDLQQQKMSKGMRRKFDFSLALAHQPDLLILDEPSSGLDPIAWRTMIDILHQYMDKGNKTILMATHVIDEVKRLADFIVFMVQGQVLGIYEKDELLHSWFTYYVQKDTLSIHQLQQAPGVYEVELDHSSHYKVTSNKAIEIEQWMEQNNVSIMSKKLLELDEILLAHMKQNGYFTTTI